MKFIETYNFLINICARNVFRKVNYKLDTRTSSSNDVTRLKLLKQHIRMLLYIQFLYFKLYSPRVSTELHLTLIFCFTVQSTMKTKLNFACKVNRLGSLVYAIFAC